MVIRFNKKFLKDLAKIPLVERGFIEEFVFVELEKYETVSSIKKLEKLTGYKTFYKVRFGNYRIGFSYNNDILTAERVLHRKEIYRYFP